MPIEPTQRDQVPASLQFVTVDPKVPTDADVTAMVLTERHPSDALELWHALAVHGCEPHDALHEDSDRVVVAELALDVRAPTSIETVNDVWEVRQAVSALPAEDQQVVRLQHFEGLTHVQIAQRLGVPVGTVKSRSHRAHKRLATALAHVL